MDIRTKGLVLAAGLWLATGMDGIDAASPAAGNALARLKAGNARFVAHPEEALPVDAGKRAAVAKGQEPFAAVLSCADAQVPPEVIFHAGLGDLFVVRSAGHATDKAVLASLEYSVDRLHVPLMVVMGHDTCDAVKSALEPAAGHGTGPNLDYLFGQLKPATAAAASKPEADRMRAAVLANVEESLNDLLAGSAVLRDHGKEGHVAFVGAYYEAASGKTYFSEPVGPSPAEPHATGGHQ